MILPFVCPNCKKDKWMIQFTVENKNHTIICANCAYTIILEDVFKPKRTTDGRKPKEAKSNAAVVIEQKDKEQRSQTE